MESNKSQEEFRDKLFDIIKHIENVHKNGKILCEKLIKKDELDFSRRLIERIFQHDVSKFSYLEFNYMDSENPEFKKFAIEAHRRNNRHHLHYHTDHKQMDDLDIAEFVVDIKSRSEEFGTNVREYFKKFIEDNKISTSSTFYKRALYYFDILLEEPFKKI